MLSWVERERWVEWDDLLARKKGVMVGVLRVWGIWGQCCSGCSVQ